MTDLLDDPETLRLATELAALTGETLSDALHAALAQRLERELLRRGESAGLADQLAAIGRDCVALPDFDTRSPEKIVGYDEYGMWT